MTTENADLDRLTETSSIVMAAAKALRRAKALDEFVAVLTVGEYSVVIAMNGTNVHQAQRSLSEFISAGGEN